ncbi:MAG: 2-C-methyl-D-erythritol 4-phosphate cytidylyltransferase [Gammaproteobacteria bacterium]|nr:2-C-methyl-D-erythritol 4-phosphate cytidylyltransferase [Gammaproteobacteria bacterium]
MFKAKYWVILPAAGTGQRFGGNIPKQYLSLNGKSILEHTVAKFLYHPRIEKIIITLDPNDYYWPQLRLEKLGSKIIAVKGGAQRCHSVYQGLQALASLAHPQDFVLVHDVVRPCLDHSDIDKLIAEVGDHPVGGILGTRVRDTLKHTNTANEIIDTVSRENIWQALTPQMFRYKLLTQSLYQAISQHQWVTDEAAAIEAIGFIPLVIEGRRDNIKITYPEDLLIAEKYCQ